MPEHELATRTSVTAYYSRSQLLIIAEGKLPTPDWEIDISQDHSRTDLPTFVLTRRPRPGDTSTDETPFRYGEIFTIGRPPDYIMLRHVDGTDKVNVEFTRDDLVDIVLSLSLEDNASQVLEIPLSLDSAEDDLSFGGADPSRPIMVGKPASPSQVTQQRQPPPPPSRPVQRRPAAQPSMGLQLSQSSGYSSGSSENLSDMGVRYRESVGYSNKLSFDEAFADALKKLPPPSMKFPDMMETVEVVHIGGTFGGIAGFHRMEVRIRAYPD
ncbi:MAG: hypothetical protein ACPG4T_21250 [Nannocystaceae bacterium]